MLFDKEDKILFIGDSVSDCGRQRPVGEGFSGAWGRGYVANIGAWLGSEFPQMKLRVINMGVDGDTVRDLARRWQRDVLDIKPDWVCVLIGINDVWRQFDSPNMHEQHVLLKEYRETYEQLIGKTLPNVKGMILLTPFYIENNLKDAMRSCMEDYIAAVRQLGEKYKMPVVDLQSAWDRMLSFVHSSAISWDRVHPNDVGHMHIARQFMHSIGS